MLKFVNNIFRFFTWILVFIITIFIFFSLYNFISIKFMNKNYTNFFGYSMFEVISGSMSPTIMVNDLILVKNTKNVNENDIITYYSDGDFITHRVINVFDDFVVTKGDANNSEDVNVEKNNIVGKVILCIPKGGLWRRILIQPKVIISILITLLLFGLCFSYTPLRKHKKCADLDNNFSDFDCINKK